jgi:hypothetical protein
MAGIVTRRNAQAYLNMLACYALAKNFNMRWGIGGGDIPKYDITGILCASVERLIASDEFWQEIAPYLRRRRPKVPWNAEL